MEKLSLFGLYESRIYELKQTLKDSDEIAFAYLEGDLSDIEWEYTKNKRKQIRQEIKSYEAKIEELKKAS